MDISELQMHGYITISPIENNETTEYTLDYYKNIVLEDYCKLCTTNEDGATIINSSEYQILQQLEIVESKTKQHSIKVCLKCKEFLQKIEQFKEICLVAQKKLRVEIEEIIDEIDPQSDTAEKTDKKVPAESRKKIVNGVVYWTCLDCDESFSSRHKLRFHRKQCQLIGSDKSKRVGQFACEVCGKMLPSLTGLRVHKYVHRKGNKSSTGESKEDKKIQTRICDICGKECKNNSRLKAHLQFHTKEKSIECEICNKKFFRTSHLKDHLDVHTNVRQYTCSECGKMFYRKEVLRKHQKTHMDSLKKYSCNLCPKKFTYPYQLKTHLMVHTGDKPHTCKLCSEKFRFSWDLRKHTDRCHHPQSILETLEIEPVENMFTADVDFHTENDFTNIGEKTDEEVAFYNFMEC